MDERQENVIHPGPEQDSLLTEQATHISDQLWRGQERDTTHHILRIQRSESLYWTIYNEPARYGHDLVIAGIRGSCLAGVSSIGHMDLDHSLITAVIERWRRETHTFHLTCGEVTITLQDVQVLMGLPTVGRPVILSRRRWSVDDWAVLISRLFGIPRDGIPSHVLSRSFLRADFLLHHFRLIAPQTPAEIDHHIRFHLLYLLHMLLGDSSGNKIKLELLIFLEDYHTLGEYSWGGAVLAYLYRSLCTGALATTRTIGGPLIILQLWTWERVRILSPVIVRPFDQHGSVRGCYWARAASYLQVSRHTLRAYRDELDHMPVQAFLWEPYQEFLHMLPHMCLEGSELWPVRCPLIFLWVVEWHYADRVLRQFGSHQPIPRSPGNGHPRLHACGGKGRELTDWTEYHAADVTAWADRVPIDPVHDADTEEYMRWYRRHTRLYIVNPAQHPPQTGYHGTLGRIGYMAESLSHLLHMAHNSDDSPLRDAVVRMATNALISVGAHELVSRPPGAPAHRARVHRQTRRPQPYDVGPSTSTRRRRGESEAGRSPYDVSSPLSDVYRPDMDYMYQTPVHDTAMGGTTHGFDYQTPQTASGLLPAFGPGSYGDFLFSGPPQEFLVSQTQTQAFPPMDIDDTQEEEEQQDLVRRGPHRAARDRFPPCGTHDEPHHPRGRR